MSDTEDQPETDEVSVEEELTIMGLKVTWRPT